MVRKILLFFVAIVFAVSAVSKLISVEYFQQFLYSFGLISFSISIVVARLTIALEIIIALLLIMQIWQKKVIGVTLFLLLLFSLFILYLEVFTQKNECYCFGTLIQFSNKFSLLKNLLLICLLCYLYISAEADQQWLSIKKSYLLLFAIFVGVISSFAVNFPTAMFGYTSENKFCKPCLDKFADKNSFYQRKTILCFFSTKCKYCKLAAQRIDVMATKYNMYNGITFVLWDDFHDPMRFYSDLQIHNYKSIEMNVLDFLDLTKGVMPLIVLYDKGKVVHSYRFADLDEGAVLQFLKAN